jgi:hypothetical protein
MKKLLIFLFLLIACPAWGTTYYVNGDTASTYVGTQGTYGVGNDTNAGTSISAPKETIQAALTASGNGDHIIYIAQYTYTAGFSSTRTGTKTITADGTVSISSASGTTITQTAGSIIFNNITLSGASGGKIIQISGGTSSIILNSCTLVGNNLAGGFNHVAGDITINNSVVSGAFADDFILSGTATTSSDVITINGLTGTLETTGDSFLRTSGSATIDIENLGTSTSRFSVTGTPSCIVETNATGKSAAITLKNWYITLDVQFAGSPIRLNGGVYAISIDGLDIVATANYAPAAASNGIIYIANQVNPQLKNLNITSSGTDDKTHVLIRGGASASSPTLTDSTFTTASESGYLVSFGDEASTDVALALTPVITGNSFNVTAETSSIHTVMIYRHVDADVFRNVFTSAGGGYAIVLKGVTDATNWTDDTTPDIAYNLFKGAWDHPILYFKGVSYINVVNNTFAVSGAPIVLVGNDSQNSTNISLKNNIIQAAASVLVSAPENQSFTSTNNILYRVDDGAYGSIFGACGDGFCTALEWIAAYPSDITGDPLFVSATNYHLQSGSPARGAGVNVGLSNTNPPDIGAEPYVQYVPWR